ncbi:MAG: hypothetical protein ACTHU0_26835 [Kofleriaceae bacterium]
MEPSDPLLTLRDVATRLGISEQRVYQLDAVLEPVFSARGTKMRTRRYRAEVVERVRTSRHRDREVIDNEAHAVWHRAKTRAARTGIAFALSAVLCAVLCRLPCVFCAAPAEHTHDLERLDDARVISESNAAACCTTCRRMKGDLDVGTFYKQVAAIAANLHEVYTEPTISVRAPD